MRPVDCDLLYKSFGRLVADKRKLRDLTQSDLAQCVGLSRASVANIERGSQYPQLHTIFEIAEALKVDVVDLIAPLQFSKPLHESPFVLNWIDGLKSADDDELHR